MGEEEIALILRTEVSQNSISDIISLETQITSVKDQLKGMVKAGEQASSKFQELKTVEKSLTTEKRKLNRELNKSIKDFERFGDALPIDSTEGMAREAANLRRVLRIQSKEVVKNDKVIEELGLTYSEAEAKSKKLRDEVRDADKALGDYSTNIGNYASTVSGLGGIFESISGVSLGFASGNPLGSVSEIFKMGEQLPGVLGKVSGALGKIPVPALAAAAAIGQSVNYAIEINNQFDKLRNQVGLVTQASGTMLVEQTASIKAFSDTFEKGFNETLEAAQAISKGFGISIQESMDLLAKGALGGADAYGELLQKAREYPKVLANAGYSAEDFIKIITQEVRGGIYDDKLTDAIKEAGLSLTEFTIAQKDALADSFGNDFANNLFRKINAEGATTKDIIGEITKEAEKNGLSVQQMAVITADIFKGAGEDAGGLQSIMDNLTLAMAINTDELVDEQDDYTAAQIRTLDANERLATAQARLSSILGSSDSRWKVFAKNLKAFGTEQLNKFIVTGEVLFSYLDALMNWDSSLIKTELQIIEGAAQEVTDALEKQNKIEADQSKRSEEIEARKKRLDKEKKERDKNNKKVEAEKKKAAEDQIKLEEKMAKDAKKREEDYLVDQKEAAKKIIDINNQLIEDEFKKREEEAKTKSSRAILSLVGTPEQIKEQSDLLGEQLDNELEQIAIAKDEKIKLELEKDRKGLEEAKLEKIEVAKQFASLLAENAIEDEEELQKRLREIEILSVIERNRIKLQNQDLTEGKKLEILRQSAQAEKDLNESKNTDITEANQEAIDARKKMEEDLEDAYEEGLQSLGAAFGALFDGQEDSMKAFGKALTGILFDILEKAIKANAISALAIEVGSKGFLGLPTGFAAQAFVLGLLKGLRSALKFEDGGDLDQSFSFPAKRGGMIRGPSHSSRSGGVPFLHKKSGRQGLAEGGEMILNKSQQLALMGMAGNDIFRRAGVPLRGGIRKFEGGGSFIPNIARIQPKSVGSSGAFGGDQLILMSKIIGEHIKEFGLQSEEKITRAIIAASDEKNKRSERELYTIELNTL